MRNSYFIAIIVLTLSMTGCKMKKFFIDESDIAWFQCYENGDTLIFQSDGGSLIKYTVDTIYIKNPLNNNPYDWEGTSLTKYFEVTDRINGIGIIKLNKNTVILNNKPKNKVADVSFYIQKSGIYYDDGLQIYFGDAAVYDYGRKFLNKAKESYMSDKKDCIFRASDYMIEKDPNDSITDFVWSRERGLLSFTVRDTATYRLVERIPRNKSSATGLQ